MRGVLHDFTRRVAVDHLVADFESEHSVVLALLQPLLEGLGVEFVADEDQTGLPLLVFPPTLAAEVAGKKRVHALKHKLLRHALHRKDALIPIQIVPHVLDEVVDPPLQFVNAQVALELEAHGTDGRAVLVCHM